MILAPYVALLVIVAQVLFTIAYVGTLKKRT